MRDLILGAWRLPYVCPRALHNAPNPAPVARYIGALRILWNEGKKAYLTILWGFLFDRVDGEK